MSEQPFVVDDYPYFEDFLKACRLTIEDLSYMAPEALKAIGERSDEWAMTNR